MILYKNSIFCLALMAVTASAFAHETWLSGPKSVAVSAGTTVTFDLTSGMAFPTLDYAIKSERIERALCRLQNKTTPLSQRKRGARSLQLTVPLAESGCATVWVQLKPKTLELTPAKVDEYFKEINAPESVRRTWATSPAPRHWRETYVKCAKTFVRVGSGNSDRSWQQPVGLALEIVPQKNPTLLHTGEELPVQVLKQGKPFAHFALGLRHKDDTNSVFHQTDAQGHTTFRLDRSGKWMLHGTSLAPSQQPDMEWESQFTTFTFAVNSH